jgi:hypothetical protein
MIEPSKQNPTSYETRLVPLSPHVVAQGGDVYVLTLDGSDNESTVGVSYTNGKLSKANVVSALIASLPAKALPFRGTAEERQQVETATYELLTTRRRRRWFRAMARSLRQITRG